VFVHAPHYGALWPSARAFSVDDLAHSGDDGWMSIWDDEADAGRAPICPYCGVTALPSELSHVLDTDFVCDNADCDAYGERIEGS
jgi:hypothetical protein